MRPTRRLGSRLVRRLGASRPPPSDGRHTLATADGRAALAVVSTCRPAMTPAPRSMAKPAVGDRSSYGPRRQTGGWPEGRANARGTLPRVDPERAQELLARERSRIERR